MLKEVRLSIELYAVVAGRLPSSLDELVTGGQLDSVPRDPWGQPFYYRPAHGSYELRVVGPDGRFGTQDDVLLGAKNPNCEDWSWW
jgi:hypothetical protein